MIDKKLALLMFKNRHSQSEIARKLGVSRQRIHQVLTGYKSFAQSAAGKSYINLSNTTLKPFCELCQKERTVVGHHINHNTKNNSQSNIMSLCIGCHYEVHLGEKTKKIIGKERLPTWSRKYKECIICKNTKKMYGGYGLCSLCYRKYWYHKMKKQKSSDI